MNGGASAINFINLFLINLIINLNTENIYSLVSVVTSVANIVMMFARKME